MTRRDFVRALTAALAGMAAPSVPVPSIDRPTIDWKAWNHIQIHVSNVAEHLLVLVPRTVQLLVNGIDYTDDADVHQRLASFITVLPDAVRFGAPDACMSVHLPERIPDGFWIGCHLSILDEPELRRLFESHLEEWAIDDVSIGSEGEDT